MEAFSLQAFLMTSMLAIAPPNDPKQVAKVEVYEIPVMAGLWQVAAKEATQNDSLAADSLASTCLEQYNFGLKGHLKTVSANEMTYGQYRYVPQEEGLPILAVKTIYDNNEPDCAGDKIDQSGQAFATFVSLDSRDNPTQMQWCNDKEGQSCSLTFYRVQP